MAAIHDLLAQVQDEALRARLEQEINRLSKTKKFGLVFEEHLPELTSPSSNSLPSIFERSADLSFPSSLLILK